MCRAGRRSVRLTRGTTASMYPADTIPASQPACVLVKDQAAMNCGRSAGIMEYPSTLRISAPHTAATIAAEGAVRAELTELTVYPFRSMSCTETEPLSVVLGGRAIAAGTRSDDFDRLAGAQSA